MKEKSVKRAGAKTGIEWTDATWNPVVGCTPVSPGCLNCYAATMAPRLAAMGQEQYVGLTVKRSGSTKAAGPVDASVGLHAGKVSRNVFNGTVRTLPDRLTAPLHWKKPRMVFVNSMSDLFHEQVPFEFIDKVFAVMALCPQHTFQVLTKRPERMAKYFRRTGMSMRIGVAAREIVGRSPLSVFVGGRVEEAIDRLDYHNCVLPNVWLGTSVEDQARANERIPHLLRCPAAVRFLSCEPLLGQIDLSGCMTAAREIMGLAGPYVAGPDAGVHWVIVGGESGAHARPCDVACVRSIVNQCRQTRVPCFVKQLGSRVHCRNDEVSDWLDEVGMGLDYVETEHARMQGDPVRVLLNDRKGGDPSEWPEDLRVRQMPERDCPPPF